MADVFDVKQAYQAVPNPVQPDLSQTPGSFDLNPIGSEYADAFSKNETILIKRAIQEAIFDATPAKYKVLKLLFDQPVKYVGNDEFTYLEKTFGRVALKASAGVVAGPTQVLPLTAGGAGNVTINKIIVYPNNRKGIVSAVDVAADEITVKTFNGQADLPEVFQDDVFAIGGTVIADGMNFLAHYDRMKKIEKFNFVQLMHRDKRWTRMEMQKFQNLGTTNYYDLDKKEQMELLLQDMFAAFWNGERGEVDLAIPGNAGDVYKAKTMGGIYPTMVAAGSAVADAVTKVTLQPAFEKYVFETDYKAEGSVRYIFAQNALLYQLSKVFKEPGIRYTPNDKVADLNLMEYRFGDMRFVPVATELFKEPSMFPTSWSKRIFILDKDAIQPVCMTGYMPIEMGQTAPKGQNGSLNDFTEWWIQGMLSLQFNNPLGSFILNTENVV